MLVYTCQNSNCGETWEQDENGSLVPGLIGSGLWEHLSDSSKGCPACDDREEDWLWIKNNG